MKKKDFDCVEMKNRIQAQRREEYEGLDDAEIRRRIESELASSDDPISKWWRSIAKSERDAVAHK